MAITAADVKKLRDQTGAGMMDSKKALTEADGDFEKAAELAKQFAPAAPVQVVVQEVWAPVVRT